MKILSLILANIVFTILAGWNLLKMANYYFLLHQTTDASIAGVFALFSIWVAEKLYGYGSS